MHRNRSVVFLAILLSLLSLLVGCHHVPIHRELKCTKKLARSVTGETLDYAESLSETIGTEYFNKELSRDQAIHTALLNNRKLRARLWKLGIAKSDLVQAGLLQNPTVSASFNIPHKSKQTVTNIEIESSLVSITDLWQLPLRKRTFTARLEQTISQFVNDIFQTMASARCAYDSVLYAEEQLVNIKNMLQLATNLHNVLEHRYEFGLESDADLYLARASVDFWHTKMTLQTAQCYRARVHLNFTCGIDPSCMSYSLTETFTYPPTYQNVASYLDWAKIDHPKIQLANKKICYLENLLHYERSRRIKKVDLGVAYKQDFESRNNGIGPYFFAEVPLFDTNHAIIARTEFELREAEDELSELRLNLTADILGLHEMLSALKNTITQYRESTLSLHKKALDYAMQHQKIMQISLPTTLEIHRQLYAAQHRLLKLIYRSLSSYTALEQAVGRRLSQVVEPEAQKSRVSNGHPT